MKTRAFFVVLMVLMMLLVPKLAGADPLAPGDVKEHNEGAEFTIDYTTYSAYNPAVAYSPNHGQFLVVWESAETYTHIYGRYVDAQTGTVLGSRFLIDNSSIEKRYPDVAYDPYHDRFVVIWRHGDITKAVKAKVLYGEYKGGASQFPDDALVHVTAPGETGGKPQIALNNDDHVFMIVYDSGSVGIKGRMANIDTSITGDLSVSTNFFVMEITGPTTVAANPDVAWSSQQGVFFAVFEKKFPDSETYISGIALYDTFQTSGTQTIPDSESLVGRDYTNHYDCLEPSVAYDPVQRYFVTVFVHKAIGGEAAQGHIRASFSSDVSYATANSLLAVETTINSIFLTHHSPQISYSGVGGTMHVVYITESKDIFDNEYYHVMQRNLWDTTGIGHLVTNRLEVARGVPSQQLDMPAVSGSHNGRSLVAWGKVYVSLPFEPHDSTGADWDLYARRIAPYWVQLPVMLKK
jgi:hypothetical protein